MRKNALFFWGCAHPAHRRAPVKQKARPGWSGLENGSGRRTRTADLVVNSHPLYRLSYAGTFEAVLVARHFCRQGASPMSVGVYNDEC